jgi:hypothetical protein
LRAINLLHIAYDDKGRFDIGNAGCFGRFCSQQTRRTTTQTSRSKETEKSQRIDCRGKTLVNTPLRYQATNKPNAQSQKCEDYPDQGGIVCAHRTGGASTKRKADRQPQNQSITVVIADFL